MNRIILFVLIIILPCSPCRSESSDFVQVEGTQFVLDGYPFYFVGTNMWYGPNLGSTGPGGDRDRLNRELDLLASLGITNIRTMAGSEGPNTEPYRIVPALQTAPGIHDTLVLDGLDYFLKAMNDRDLRVVMCLTNFWHWSGGMAQYVNWNGGGPIPYPPPHPGGDWNDFQDYSSDFYSNEGAKQDFLNHISFIINHVNAYTGVAYKDDPTIMVWELANEPRGFNNATAFNHWIDTTAAYIKSLDSNHLVTTGCEGDTPWPSWNGLDFDANHDCTHIDYATIHIWPENWGWYNPADPEGTFESSIASARTYFSDHEAEAVSLGKPLVLEEFGLGRDGGSHDPASTTVLRDSLLTVLYEEVYTSASLGGPAAGDNFWACGGEGRPLEPFGGYWNPGDPWIGDPPHERQGWYSVYDADTTTLAVLASHSTDMASLVSASTSELQNRTELGTLLIYPSPSSGPVAITGTLPTGFAGGTLEVFDVTGRRIVNYGHSGHSFDISWPASENELNSLSSGVYFVRFSWAEGSMSSRFVHLK